MSKKASRFEKSSGWGNKKFSFCEERIRIETVADGGKTSNSEVEKQGGGITRSTWSYHLDWIGFWQQGKSALRYKFCLLDEEIHEGITLLHKIIRN